MLFTILSTVILFRKLTAYVSFFIICIFSHLVSYQYVFITLAIFKKNIHNKITYKFENKLEAWLTFLSEDNLEIILKLIEAYPEFKALYEDGYRLCLNTEEVMRMFSKELAEMKSTISEKDIAISEIQSILSEKEQLIEDLTQKIKLLTKQLQAIKQA